MYTKVFTILVFALIFHLEGSYVTTNETLSTSTEQSSNETTTTTKKPDHSVRNAIEITVKSILLVFIICCFAYAVCSKKEPKKELKKEPIAEQTGSSPSNPPQTSVPGKSEPGKNISEASKTQQNMSVSPSTDLTKTGTSSNPPKN